MSWTGTDPEAWAKSGKAIVTGILRNSVQELALYAGKTIPNGGRVPVKTGNLARSVVVSLTPPTVKEGPFDGDITSGIAAIKPGDTIYIGWQANYSRRQNYGYVGTDAAGRYYGSAQAVITTGYSNRAGYGFAEATASQWGRIVAEQAARVGGV